MINDLVRRIESSGQGVGIYVPVPIVDHIVVTPDIDTVWVWKNDSYALFGKATCSQGKEVQRQC